MKSPIFSYQYKNQILVMNPKLSPVTLIVDPTFGFSGIILNVESEKFVPHHLRLNYIILI